MIPIGGYFELELNKGKEYYPDLLALSPTQVSKIKNISKKGL